MDKVDKKLDKLLKKFLEHDSSIESRFKTILSFLDKCNINKLTQEEENFFKRYTLRIFETTVSTLSNYEVQCSKGKFEDSKLANIFTVVRKLIEHNEVFVNERASQFASDVLTKFLWPNNKRNYRFSAFKILLSFVQVLQDSKEAYYALIPAAVDFSPFDKSVKLDIGPMKESPIPLMPRDGKRAGKADATELFITFLDHISFCLNDRKLRKSFDEWWMVFRTYFIPTLYPKVCKESDQLRKNEDTGFQHHCPYELQEALVPRLEQWLGSDYLVVELFSDKFNAAILLEMMKQTCKMPIKYRDTMKRAITAFHKALFSESARISDMPNIVQYRKAFFNNLVEAVEGVQLEQDHMKLTSFILDLYKGMVGQFDRFSEDIKQSMLYTALRIVQSVLLPSCPPKDNVDNMLCPILVDTVLFLWIHTKTKDLDRWKHLQNGLSLIMKQRKDAIAQLQKQLIQLTIILRDNIYTFQIQNEKDAKAKRKNKQPLESRTPDYKEAEKYKVDHTVQQLEWDYPTAKLVWTNLLEILRHCNENIESEELHAQAMKCLKTIVDLLLEAYDTSDYNYELTKSKLRIDVLGVFGNWLFDACALGSEYVKGKATAIGVLCRIICRHCQIHYSDEILGHFYGALKQAFHKHSNSKVTNAILVHSSNIFSLALPGANILIPYYLVELNNALTELTPEIVRERSIMLLCSLIPYSYHFKDIEISIDSEALGKQQFLKNKTLKMIEVKEKVAQLLILALTEDPKAYHKNLAMSGMTSLIYEEAFNPTETSVKIINSLIGKLLQYTVHVGASASQSVSVTALSSISSLSPIYAEIKDLNESIIFTLINGLCANIMENIHDSSLSQPVGDHFYCLLDWLVILPPTYLREKKSLMKKICHCLAIGLTSTKPEENTDPQVERLPPPEPTPEGNTDLSGSAETKGKSRTRNFVHSLIKRGDDKDTKSPRDDTTREGSSAKSGEETGGGSIESSDLMPEPEVKFLNSTTRTTSFVKVAAEALLVHFATFLFNFPSSLRYDITESEFSEIDYNIDSKDDTGEKLLFYGMNSSTLYSFDELYMGDNVKGLKKGKKVKEAEFTKLTKSNRLLYYFTSFLKKNGLSDVINFYLDVEKFKDLAYEVEIKIFADHIIKTYLNTPSPLRKILPQSVVDNIVNAKEPLHPQSFQEAQKTVKAELMKLSEQFLNSDTFDIARKRGVRLLLRNTAGRFVWDCKLIWKGKDYSFPYTSITMKQTDEKRERKRSSNKRKGHKTTASVGGKARSASIVKRKSSEKGERKEVEREEETTIIKDKRTPKNVDDLLSHLDSFVLEGAQESSPLPLTQPGPIPDTFLNECNETQKRFLRQHENDKRIISKRPKIDKTVLKVPQPSFPVSQMQMSQLLLCHLGLHEDNLAFAEWMDTINPRFKRSIHQLDNDTQGREMIKVGLIYVKKGQELEKEILRNDNSDSSKQYDEFVRGMSSIVDLEKHAGYIGKLEKDVSPTMPYFSNPTLELCFHEVVRMKTVEKDDTQLRKKRHVGNDQVHIIWSEHDRDYDPTTITSQFNYTHILVYPLPNGLFRIQIAQKKGVPHFGPLVHNMVVSKRTLPTLVRETAINAHKLIRAGQTTYQTPTMSRKKAISNILTKSAKDKNYYSYLVEMAQKTFPMPL